MQTVREAAIHKIMTDIPTCTDECASVNPLKRMFLSATAGKVNGRQLATYLKYQGIASSGQKIPVKTNVVYCYL